MNQTFFFFFASKCFFVSAKKEVRAHSLIDFKATFYLYGNWSVDHSTSCEVICEVTPHQALPKLLHCEAGDSVISWELPAYGAKYWGQ